MQLDQQPHKIRVEACQSQIPRSLSVDQQKKSKFRRPVLVDLRKTQYKIIRQVVLKDKRWRLMKPENDQQPDLVWTDSYISEDELDRMLPFQKINHFPGSFQLGNKSFLARNLAKMRKRFPEEYSYFPESWILPEDMQLFKIQQQKMRSLNWILKPANLSQGKGILIANNIQIIQQKVRLSKRQYVIQRYIQTPYLLGGLKFDLRLYVLITSLKPLEVFLFKDGLGTELLTEFATDSYQKPCRSNLGNTYMHLTNYAINKKSPLFADGDTGHKRRLSSVLEVLAGEGKNIDILMSRISRAITSTIISVQPPLSHLYSSSAPSKFALGRNCFEIFGFDFLFNENLNPYLLEVNHTPSFRTDSDVDLEVKSNLIKQTLLLLYTKPPITEVYSQPFSWNLLDPLSYIQVYPPRQAIYQPLLLHSNLLFDNWTGVSKRWNKVQDNSTCRTVTEFKKQKMPRPSTVPALSATTLSTTQPKTVIANRDQIQPKKQGKVDINSFREGFDSYYKRRRSLKESSKPCTVERRLACTIHDFVQKNMGRASTPAAQLPGSRTSRCAKTVLLKSFNRKFLREAVRSSRMQGTGDGYQSD